MAGTGPVFIVRTDCGDPYPDTYRGNGTFMSLINDTSFDFHYKIRMSVTYPAFSHNAAGMQDTAIKQICDVQLQTGEANVMTQFKTVSHLSTYPQYKIIG